MRSIRMDRENYRYVKGPISVEEYTIQDLEFRWYYNRDGSLIRLVVMYNNEIILGTRPNDYFFIHCNVSGLDIYE